MSMTIKQKQYNLYYLGYYGTSEKDVDGWWGAKSAKSTKQFQEDVGITNNGTFGPATETAIKNVLSVIQKKIGCTADGLAGKMTVEATKKYQIANGLEATGLCSQELLNKLDIDIKEAANRSSTDHTTSAAPSTTPTIVTTTTTISKVTGGDFWKEIRYFTREDFRCQCGGKYCNGFPVEPEEKMVRTVDAIREAAGVPIEIVRAGGSGIRCTRHNANVGGVYNSEHLHGRAADLHSSLPPAKLKSVVERVVGNTGGVGLYSWGVHVDTGKYSRWNG